MHRDARNARPPGLCHRRRSQIQASLSLPQERCPSRRPRRATLVCVCRHLFPVPCPHGPFPQHRGVWRLPRAAQRPRPNLLGSPGNCSGAQGRGTRPGHRSDEASKPQSSPAPRARAGERSSQRDGGRDRHPSALHQRWPSPGLLPGLHRQGWRGNKTIRVAHVCSALRHRARDHPSCSRGGGGAAGGAAGGERGCPAAAAERASTNRAGGRAASSPFVFAGIARKEGT